MKKWRILADVFIIGLCCVQAQEAQAPEGHESAAETIGRCMRDLESADVMTRRRAAMLLGKYSGPQVEAAMVRCLADPDASIRLGALVTLTEDRMLPDGAATQVFKMLSDPDVHVRRMASSRAGMAWMGGGVRRIARGVDGVLRVVQENRDREADKALLLAALQDADSSVRKNVLAVCHTYGIPVPPERLVAFLRDSAADVRLLAVQICRQTNVPAEVFAALAPLAQDPSPAIRSELCQLVMAPHEDMAALMRQMLRDEDASIRAQALRRLVQLQAPDAPELVEKALQDQDVPDEQKVALVQALSETQPSRAMEIYDRMLSSPSSAQVAAALLAFSDPALADRKPAFFIPYLDADSTAVAKAALTGIRRTLRKLDGDAAAAILASRNNAAKSLVISMGFQFLDRQQARQAILDACMDDDTAIRATALRMLPRYCPGDWVDIMTASLEDEDEAIQLAAAGTLCIYRGLPAARTALREYLPKCRNIGMKQRIQEILDGPTGAPRPAPRIR